MNERIPEISSKETKKSFSLCVMFNLPTEIQQWCGKIYEEMRSKYPDIIKERKINSLPFHITILGGAKVGENELKEKMTEIKNKIKSFQNAKRIPVINKVGACSLPMNIFGIETRLDNYDDTQDVIKGLAKDLNPEMDLELIKHISLFEITEEANNQEMQNELNNILAERIKSYEQQLINTTLSPQIWIKGDNGQWQDATNQ